jgi:hypothetical protein
MQYYNKYYNGKIYPFYISVSNVKPCTGTLLPEDLATSTPLGGSRLGPFTELPSSIMSDTVTSFQFTCFWVWA